MSEHEKIRELLALAAADALTSTEEQAVAQHLRTCEACSRRMGSLQSIARDLRRLPTPQPTTALLQRTRLLAEQKLAEEAEYRWQRGVMIFVLAFAWVLTIVSWPLVRLLTGGLLSLLDPQLNRTWVSFAGFAAFVWLAGGTAAVLMSLRQRRERRMA